MHTSKYLNYKAPILHDKNPMICDNPKMARVPQPAMRYRIANASSLADLDLLETELVEKFRYANSGTKKKCNVELAKRREQLMMAKPLKTPKAKTVKTKTVKKTTKTKTAKTTKKAKE